MKALIRTLRVFNPQVYPLPEQLLHPDANQPAARFPLSVYWQMALLLAVTFALGIIGLLLLSGNQGRPPNPFSAYHNIMPGHSRADAVSQGASCTQSTGPEPGDSCILSPSSGPFKTVKMVLLNGHIIAVNFAARANALFVGDLQSIWGKPMVHPTAHENIVVLQWPQYHISATAAHATHNSYSIIFFSVNLVLSTNDFPIE
jgi:hypothetical protein